MAISTRKASWWQWALLSVGISLLLAALTIGLLAALAFRGINFWDYIYLSHPPYITAGGDAALMALLVVSQSLVPVIGLLTFRPARTVIAASLRIPLDLFGAPKRLGIGVVFVLLLQVAWSTVAPAPPEHWRVVEHLIYAVKGGGALWPTVWLSLAIGVVGPIAEELLFRGFLFGAVRRRWGFAVGAAVSAALFGLSHGLASALPAAVLGLYLAYLTERDRSLATAIALHALNNALALLAVFVTPTP